MPDLLVSYLAKASLHGCARALGMLPHRVRAQVQMEKDLERWEAQVRAGVCCHVCGSLISADEPWGVNEVPAGGAIVNDRTGWITKGPATLYFCREHRV